MAVSQEVVTLDADTALDVVKLVISATLHVHVKTGTAATATEAKEIAEAKAIAEAKEITEAKEVTVAKEVAVAKEVTVAKEIAVAKEITEAKEASGASTHVRYIYIFTQNTTFKIFYKNRLHCTQRCIRYGKVGNQADTALAIACAS